MRKEKEEPFRGTRLEENDAEQPKSERRGPFYAPRKLTEKEIEARNRKRAMEKAQLEKILEEKDYDGKTKLIARIIGRMNFSMAKLYLWRFQLFNAGIVEGVGLIMYYALLPLFLAMSGNVYLAITLTVPISFFSKFLIYKVWLFKPLNKKGE